MKPLTRKEIFLAKIAGEDIDIEPLTREEVFLNQIAESGGGGGGGGGGSAVICEGDYDIETEAMTARMTAGELFAAIQNGSVVIFHIADEDTSLYGYLFVLSVAQMPGMYMFTVNFGESFRNLTASSEDEYPTNQTV